MSHTVMEIEKKHINSLPEEIKLSIFSRLPIESVLDCRQVCKPWNEILDFKKNTQFAYLHLRYNGGGLVLDKQQPQQHHNHLDYDSFNFVYYDSGNLYYAEFCDEEEENDDGREQHMFRTRMINLRIPMDVWRDDVGSCNGLICLTTYKTGEPSYICNPITRELVHLPRMVMDKKKKKNSDGVTFVNGFGYHPLTDKYKVVRICYVAYENEQFQSAGQVEVYTLGSGSGWRNVGETSYILPTNIGVGSVCVNGALHWLYESEEIIAFNLADEKFVSLPTPPGLFPHSTNVPKSLNVINGCLCLVSQNHGEPADVWFLKKTMQGDSSSTISYEEESSIAYSWSKEFRIAINFEHRYIRRNLFFLKNRDAIIISNGGYMTRYNLEATTSERIRSFTIGEKWAAPAPVLHVNSFVSMEALGELDVRTFVGSSDQGRLNTHQGCTPAAPAGHYRSKRTRISNSLKKFVYRQ